MLLMDVGIPILGNPGLQKASKGRDGKETGSENFPSRPVEALGSRGWGIPEYSGKSKGGREGWRNVGSETKVVPSVIGGFGTLGTIPSTEKHF